MRFGVLMPLIYNFVVQLMKKWISIVGLFLMCTAMYAQETLYDETMVVYKHQYHGGIHLHTGGWGLNFAMLKNRTAFRARVLQLEIVGINSHKQVKSYNPYYQDARGYHYGKQYSFYSIRPSWGMRKVITDKYRKNGVEVGYIWSVGPSIGIAKPVYLEIFENGIFSGTGQISVERYDVDKHYHENIYGRASGLIGWGSVRIHPGVHGRFGFLFEYANNKTGAKTIEAGVAFDGFTQVIPIMALEGSENRQFFLNLYLNLQFGKKYNKTK
jgi:hypothetical protein